jgi:hypothetical protein
VVLGGSGIVGRGNLGPLQQQTKNASSVWSTPSKYVPGKDLEWAADEIVMDASKALFVESREHYVRWSPNG